MSRMWTTPLDATLSTSMMFPTARSLDMVIWSGKVVMVSFSPAPVTSGVDPSGKEFESMLPLVMCLSSVICSSSVSDNSSCRRHSLVSHTHFAAFSTLNNGVGSPSKAALVGAKIVIGLLVKNR